MTNITWQTKQKRNKIPLLVRAAQRGQPFEREIQYIFNDLQAFHTTVASILSSKMIQFECYFNRMTKIYSGEQTLVKYKYKYKYN